jgi:hypothetical protein
MALPISPPLGGIKGGSRGEFERKDRIVGDDRHTIRPVKSRLESEGDDHPLHQEWRAVKDHTPPTGILDHHAGRQFDHFATGIEHAVAGLDSGRLHNSITVGQAGKVGENDRLVGIVSTVQRSVVDGLPDVLGSEAIGAVKVEAVGFVGQADSEALGFWRGGWCGERRRASGWCGGWRHGWFCARSAEDQNEQDSK